MAKQRYLVVIVRPASEVTYVSPGRRASLLVPFSPEAIISTFIDELWKRLARHDGAIPLTAETHNVSLHLEHKTGPAIDVEDLLSDVIADTQKEKIFAVFSRKRNIAPQLQSPRVHIKSYLQYSVASPRLLMLFFCRWSQPSSRRVIVRRAASLSASLPHRRQKIETHVQY